MRICPKLRPNLQVLCYLDTLSTWQRHKLPAVIPMHWQLDKVQAIVSGKRFVSVMPIVIRKQGSQLAGVA
jgi:hypothetical protein